MVKHVEHPAQKSSFQSFVPSSSSLVQSARPCSDEKFYDPSDFVSGCLLVANPHFAHLAFFCSANMQNKVVYYQPETVNKFLQYQNNRSHYRGRPGTTLSGRQRHVSQTERNYGDAHQYERSRASPTSALKNISL